MNEKLVSPEGAWLGTVELPGSGLDILAVGSGRVLVAERNELGVHAAAVYILPWPDR